MFSWFTRRASLFRYGWLLVLCSCVGGGPPQPTVVVFAATSTTDAFEEIRSAFEQQTGVRVKVNYASSSTLAKQILAGADPDLFISANQVWANAIAEAGLVADRANLLGNRLVIITAKDAKTLPRTIKQLLGPDVERISIADPESVPAGIYAKQAVTKLGHWPEFQQRIVIGADVRHALAHVSSGGAQAGIVYATDAAISDAVQVSGEIDAELTEEIVYPLVMTTIGVRNEAAQQLFEFIMGESAAASFTKFGFVVRQVEAP